MVYQSLAILLGLVSGVVWEILGAIPFKNIPTITPSLIIKLSGGQALHLHHWLAYAIVLIIITFWSAKTGRLFHPSILMIFAFLLSAIIYDFLKFPDWHVFVKWSQIWLPSVIYSGE